MKKRLLLASLCEKTGVTEALLRWRRRRQSPWLPILTFHRVAKVTPEYRFDEGVIGTTPDELASQIAVVGNYFNSVSLEDVMQFVDGAPLPENPVLVTFDDGYRDNREIALPILQRHGVKAVFFIATDYLTRRRIFWWDRISYILKTCAPGSIALAYPSPLVLDVNTHEQRTDARRVLLRVVKSTFGLDLERFLTELASAAAVPWSESDERRSADELLMTWDQVRELRAAGMSVQSHTRSHRVLQTLRPAQLADELEGSRLELERQLQERIYAISYPVGHTIDDRADVRRALRDAGYKIGFTNATGAQPVWRKVDRYSIRRMSLALHTPKALFRAMLAVPTVFESGIPRRRV